ncbi:MAG TPA: Crp/Fnr family transcriptional regulator [Bacteroidia bacterium]|nr:Crp/Fnr family transcriptional regulator [Bacteroidia bacterium]
MNDLNSAKIITMEASNRVLERKAAIELEVLLANGASFKKVKKDELIFEEGTHCLYYFQLVEGRVRWVNINEQGKEFIQNIIEPGECFGELPLFDNEPYAASCFADKDSIILRLPKESFLSILKENSELHFKFTKMFAERMRYKFLILKTIASENPTARISVLLNHLKKRNCEGRDKTEIQLTRQQIANMTGLRVETVIRAIKKLDNNENLSIENGKIFIA